MSEAPADASPTPRDNRAAPPRHNDPTRFAGEVTEPEVDDRLAELRQELDRQLDAADPLDPGVPLPTDSRYRVISDAKLPVA